MKKKLMVFAITMALIVPAFALALPALAQTDVDFGTEYAENIGLSSSDPREMAANLVRIIMTFLSIIAVVIILLGGFKWMTAGGNEEKVEEAKKLIKAGVIGLVIIIAAWGIANFVISSLKQSV
jgi:hypothetical protein